MELKKYQQKAVDVLAGYLKELSTFSPKHAFISATGKPYSEVSFGEVPFVCVKIPTGGGKTLVGCHAVREIMQSVLKTKLDHGIVMWFVPSEAIKTQTLKKFRNKNDWHRRALDEAFEGSVRIFSNEEALSINKGDVDDNLCVVVSSLDAFRKEKTLQNKYKVYKENGALLNHFEHLKNDEGLEKDSEGTVINSLANVVRMNNPLIVIDEGHKTTTKLSIDFIKELNPVFIIEYTATPRDGSNILVDIGPAELKTEQMVKIPIVLESANQWQNSISQGIDKRNELEKLSKKLKSEYIRPIVLLQAQSDRGDSSITVEKVKEYLLKAMISEEEIAIKTSEKNELEGIDLFSRKCKIRYIITVNALAEGWDCSFAYVLVSIANIGAKIAVEQIIGRIIRMPYAKKKVIEDLNRCYVFASAKNFNEAAGQIISGLESNGYSRSDVINASKKSFDDELEVKKAVKENLSVPMVSFGNDKLAFEDLIGEDFELSKQKVDFKFDAHYDSDGRAVIDISKDNKWVKGKQQILNLTYKDKNFSKEELVQWLDKKLRFSLLDKEDKVRFIAEVVDEQLKKKSLSELSVNRYVLAERLGEAITSILEQYAKQRFDKFLKDKKILAKGFDKFPGSIILNQEIPQEFNKNYYGKVDKLNKEELVLAERLDTLPNIKYWVRNREKVDPFYIQGWKKNKSYPDFIAVTKKGHIIALEWKGEDRISNEDTDYKVEIGNMWAKLGKGKLHFFLVHNKNVEEVLLGLKSS